jgi:hypothetical protein
VFLPPGTPPPRHDDDDDYVPESERWEGFSSRAGWDFAHLHFVEAQSSEGKINKALDIWTASVMEYGGSAPWTSAQELYSTIDNIQHGDAPFQSIKIKYNGPRPAGTPPPWMTETYELCTRNARSVLVNQMSSRKLCGSVNLRPYRQFDENGNRVYSNFMSGNYAWKQSVSIVLVVNLLSKTNALNFC